MTARGRQHLDPLVVEEFPQRFRDVAIFAVSQGVVPLNDRNATAEASQGLGHLESDIAAPQNEEVLRDAVQFEGLDVRHRPRFGEAGDWVNPRAGARADHDDFAAKGARTVVGRHLDRSRPDEAALPLDKLRAALSIRIDITSDNAIDHLPLAIADSWHLDFPVARGDAEFGASAEIVGDLGTVDHVLARAQAMVGQDPARLRRSTTATRFPCEASDQAKDLALPLPSTTTSYSSGCDMFFPLRVNPSR